MLAGWTVYKFHKPLRKGIRSMTNKGPQGTYNSLNEALVKTKKGLIETHGDHEIRSRFEQDEHGKYWVIEVVTFFFHLIFVPVETDED